MNIFYALHEICSGQVAPLEVEQFYRMVTALPQYDDAHDFRLADVSISDTHPLCNSVSRERIKNSESLIRHYKNLNLQPFVPIVLYFKDVYQIVFPPVVHLSEADGYHIILDGMHRLYTALQVGYKSVTILGTSGPVGPLPGMPINWDNVLETEKDLPVAEKFIGFRREAFAKPFTVTLNGEWLWHKIDGK